MVPTPKPHLARVERTRHAPESRRDFELMDRNERTVDFPPAVMEDLRRLITPFLLRAYPEPEPLCRKLASWLGVSREQVLVTWGADGGLRSAFEAYAGPGDDVVCASPSFGMYPVYGRLVGASVQEVRFGEDLSLPLERILARIGPRTKVVALANPNQPIERVYEEAEMRRLAEACGRAGALLVMDEAYHHFCPLTALPLLKEFGHVLVVRTFSKAFGAAGLRLGYCVGQPELIGHLTQVRPMYEGHAIGMAIGCYLLDHLELMQGYVAQVKASLELLRDAFGLLGFQTWGRWGNSILVAMPQALPAPALAAALRSRGFLVRAETQTPLGNHLRITVGPKEQAERLMAAITAVLARRDEAGLPAAPAAQAAARATGAR